VSDLDSAKIVSKPLNQRALVQLGASVLAPTRNHGIHALGEAEVETVPGVDKPDPGIHRWPRRSSRVKVPTVQEAGSSKG